MMRRASANMRKVEVENQPTIMSPKSPNTSSDKSKLVAVSQELVARSLRRRFWHALQQEDGKQALRIYQATRSDWECMLLEESAGGAASEEGSPNNSCARRRSLTKKQTSLTNIPVLKKERPAWRARRSNKQTTVDLDSSLLSLSFVKEDENASNIILPQILNPCDCFIEDDFQPVSGPYLEISIAQTSNIPTNETPPPRRGGWFRRTAPASTDDQPTNAWLLRVPQDASYRTTPLHEAARIGSGDLVRCLLEWAGGGDHYDTNIKNGLARTPLHCAAGGLTREEATRASYQDELAILAPQPYRDGDEQRSSRTGSGSRFRLSKVLSKRRMSEQDLNASVKKVSNEQIRLLARDRMDAVMALLTSDASTNVVDQHGRTPLHYAAGLGRTDMSFALFNSFGTLLTVVDGFSRTPAEWAALHGHATLAAQLEARALLYMDPLDMDLLDEQNGDQAGKSQTPATLSPPFSWFTTFAADRVQREREFRVKTTFDRMKKIVARLNGGRSGRDLLYKPSSSSHSRSESRDSVDLTPQSSHSDSSNPPSPVPGQDLSSLDSLNEGAVAEFLIFHKWDVKTALATFYEDPVGSISQAKISLTQLPTNKPATKDNPQICLICCDEFGKGAEEWRDLNCGHGFCVSCLGEFITSCAKSREFTIRCPHHECSVAMSPAEVSDLTPSKEIKDMMIETANNNFVVQANDFRFCPHQGCSNAVKFIPPKNKPSELHSILSSAGAVCTTPESHAKRKDHSPFITYEGTYDEPYFDCQSGVQPKRAHRFCFHCGEASHWPVSCSRLEKWKATIEENVKDAEAAEGDDYNEVSHKLWLKANTRPCPKCKAPIEKNDGCNHMTCSNPACKHEFCWICRNDWSLHGTSTGGFFRCNRWAEEGEGHQYYDSPPSAEQMRNPTEEDLSDPRRMRAIYGTAMHETRIAHKKSREMARFLHHYQRFSAHSDSARLEAKMADTCAERMKPIVVAAVEFSGDPSFNFGGKGLSFVYDAFTELRECRSVLQHSYAFSYFRYTRGGRSRNSRRKLAEGLAFEQMQSDLEMVTEQMSDLVARAQMRATQSQILYLTLTAAQKRRDFSSYMMRVLAKSKEEGESSENNSEGSEGDNPPVRLPFFQPIHTPGAEGAFITGLAPRGDMPLTAPHRQRGEGFFGDLGTDPALQASIQAFRETTGAMDLLRLNTSYDSQDSDEDMFDRVGGRQWSCSACTYINTRGRSCAMCGTFDGGH